MTTSSELSPVKVLFIAGTGRSGTTILSNILGQVPGCLSVGEVRYVWERGIVQDHRCGCGESFSRCKLWTAVLQQAHPRLHVSDAAAIARRLERRLRIRRLPWMLWRWIRGRPVVKPHTDDVNILRVYQALSRREGVQMVVDSSKLPPYGMLLRSLPGVELYVLHVVRDPRATAFSWRRAKPTHDAAPGATMPQLQAWRSAVLWTLWNLLIDVWWRRSSKHRLLVRYEDLVQEPAATLQRVLELTGSDLPHGLFCGHSVTLLPTHSVAGNPSRHSSGVVELRGDHEWQGAMRSSQRAVVTALTAPGLRRFGYSFVTKGAEDPASSRFARRAS
jgi:hypothetical protein